MAKRMVGIVALLVVGCGPGADFAGTYEGSLVLTSTKCNDGPGGKTTPLPVSLKITNHSTTLRLEPGFAGCASVDLDAVGDVATIKPAKCAAGVNWPATDVVSGEVKSSPTAGLTVSAILRHVGDPKQSPYECSEFTVTGALKKL